MNADNHRGESEEDEAVAQEVRAEPPEKRAASHQNFLNPDQQRDLDGCVDHGDKEVRTNHAPYIRVFGGVRAEIESERLLERFQQFCAAEQNRKCNRRRKNAHHNHRKHRRLPTQLQLL